MHRQGLRKGTDADGELGDDQGDQSVDRGEEEKDGKKDAGGRDELPAPCALLFGADLSPAETEKPAEPAVNKNADRNEEIRDHAAEDKGPYDLDDLCDVIGKALEAFYKEVENDAGRNGQEKSDVAGGIVFQAVHTHSLLRLITAENIIQQFFR